MIKKVGINALAYFVAFIFIFPVLWVVFSSLKFPTDLFQVPMKVFPSPMTFKNFQTSWEVTDFPMYIKNTLFVAVIATVLSVTISLMCGYALAKYKFKWVNFVFIAIVSTTMLPTEVIMNSVTHVVRGLGLYNSLAGIILPVLSTSTGVFISRQFFVGVPNSLSESARIDGANEFQIFFRLMLPLAKPIIAVLTIFSFRWRWNDYIWPLIVLNDPKKYTIQLALRNLVGSESIDWSLLLASTTISIIPMLIIFILFQKQIFGTNINAGIK